MCIGAISSTRARAIANSSRDPDRRLLRVSVAASGACGSGDPDRAGLPVPVHARRGHHHGVEVAYVFGTFASVPYAPTPAETTLPSHRDAVVLGQPRRVRESKLARGKPPRLERRRSRPSITPCGSSTRRSASPRGSMRRAATSGMRSSPSRRRARSSRPSSSARRGPAATLAAPSARCGCSADRAGTSRR